MSRIHSDQAVGGGIRSTSIVSGGPRRTPSGRRLAGMQRFLAPWDLVPNILLRYFARKHINCIADQSIYRRIRDAADPAVHQNARGGPSAQSH